MSNRAIYFGLAGATLLILVALIPLNSDSYLLKKKEIRALKKVAIAATVLGQRKRILLPLPLPLPFPIPIVHKHEPIISPIDPLLTLSAAKGAKGYYGPYGTFAGGYGGGAGGGLGGGLHGGIGLGGVYRKRR